MDNLLALRRLLSTRHLVPSACPKVILPIVPFPVGQHPSQYEHPSRKNFKKMNHWIKWQDEQRNRLYPYIVHGLDTIVIQYAAVSFRGSKPLAKPRLEAGIHGVH